MQYKRLFTAKVQRTQRKTENTGEKQGFATPRTRGAEYAKEKQMDFSHRLSWICTKKTDLNTELTLVKQLVE